MHKHFSGYYAAGQESTHPGTPAECSQRTLVALRIRIRAAFCFTVIHTISNQAVGRLAHRQESATAKPTIFPLFGGTNSISASIALLGKG